MLNTQSTNRFAIGTIATAILAVALNVVPVSAADPTPAPIARIMPNLSYVRLANMSELGSSIHTVEVYGLSTRTTLGRFQVEVPAKASKQIRPTDMLQGLSQTELDQFMSLYITTSRDKQYWQHVRYDATTGAFSNASVCPEPTSSATPATPVALNVHTSRIPQYVSFVTAHNYGNAVGRYEARVYDSATGARLGSIDIELAPRQTITENGHWFHNAIGLLFPRDDQVHLNVEFVEKGSPSGARLTVAHEVYDVFAKTTANLSNGCAV